MNEGGSIITIASLNGIQPSAGMSAYCAAKAGVIDADQGRGDGARRATDPRQRRRARAGRDHCDRRRSSTVPGVVEEFVENTTLGRYAQPAEIAAMVAFLAGDESTFVSGSFFSVDGGASTKRYPDLPAAFAAPRRSRSAE